MYKCMYVIKVWEIQTRSCYGQHLAHQWVQASSKIVDTYSILSTALAGCCLSTVYHLNVGSQLPAHPTCQHTCAESNWNRSWQRLLAFQPQMHWRKQGQIFTMLTLVHCTAGDSSIFKQDMMVLTQTAGSSPPHHNASGKKFFLILHCLIFQSKTNKGPKRTKHTYVWVFVLRVYSHFSHPISYIFKVCTTTRPCSCSCICCVYMHFSMKRTWQGNSTRFN